MTKKIAKSNSKNKSAKQASKKDVLAPKRKVGRYLLALMLLVPIGMQLGKINWSQFIPNINVKKDVEITNILIEGAFVYTNKAILQTKITELLKKDFVRMDLKQIQTVLINDAWYKTASVSRVWPSSLKIVVEEQQPIARWGESGFINRYGELVKVKSSDSLSHLPVLKGLEENAYDIARDYLMMSGLMNDHQLYISSLEVNASGDWRIEVDRSFSIELGDQNISKRLERFLFLYSGQLEPLKLDLERVDMRYQNGIAVKWKGASSKPLASYASTKDIVSR